jgi:RNA polymerase sigma factor (sigma-70 family)
MLRMEIEGVFTSEGARPAPAPAAPPLRVPHRDVAYSFESFFEIEHERLFGALLVVTGNRSDAEELMQEAFTRLWARWDLVQSLANPTGYLYRTAMNLLRMRRRRARALVRRTLSRRTGHDGFEDAFDQVEVRADVRRALAGLAERQRAALVLTELLRFPSDEAARVLGVRPSTVRSLATQARSALRTALSTPPPQPLEQDE